MLLSSEVSISGGVFEGVEDKDFKDCAKANISNSVSWSRKQSTKRMLEASECLPFHVTTAKHSTISCFLLP